MTLTLTPMTPTDLNVRLDIIVQLARSTNTHIHVHVVDTVRKLVYQHRKNANFVGPAKLVNKLVLLLTTKILFPVVRLDITVKEVRQI